MAGLELAARHQRTLERANSYPNPNRRPLVSNLSLFRYVMRLLADISADSTNPVKTLVSAKRFYASLSLSSPPRKMRKNARQRLTSVAVAMAVRRPPWCITVWSWSFVLILCYFEYLDVRARVMRARARFRTFSCVFVQYNTNQTRYRDLRTNP